MKKRNKKTEELLAGDPELQKVYNQYKVDSNGQGPDWLFRVIVFLSDPLGIRKRKRKALFIAGRRHGKTLTLEGQINKKK